VTHVQEPGGHPPGKGPLAADARTKFHGLIAHSDVAAAAAAADPLAALFSVLNGDCDERGVHPMCRVLGEMAPGQARDTLIQRQADCFFALSSILAHGGVVGAGVLERAMGAAASVWAMVLSRSGQHNAALWQHGGLVLAVCRLARLAALPREAVGGDGPARVAERAVWALAECVPTLPALDEGAFDAGGRLVAAARAGGDPSSLLRQPLDQWLYPELLSTALACLQPPAPELANLGCSTDDVRRRAAEGRVRLQGAAAELLTACAIRGPEYARAVQAAVAIVPSGGDAAVADALRRLRDASGAARHMRYCRSDSIRCCCADLPVSPPFPTNAFTGQIRPPCPVCLFIHLQAPRQAVRPLCLFSSPAPASPARAGLQLPQQQG
jgi:hypothetical protein